MTPLLLVRLGTDEKDNSTLYAVIDNVLAVAMFTASNDDEALVKARAFAKDRELVCEPGLAAVAQRRSATTAELKTGQVILKLHLAAPRFLPEMYGKLYSDSALLDFFGAVRAFSTAVANDPRSEWSLGATVRGTIAAATFDLEVLLVVMPGVDPGLHVISRASADWLHKHPGKETADVDRLAIELYPYPSALIELARPAYGLDLFPHIALVEDGKPRVFDEVAVELASAYLRTAALCTAAPDRNVGYKHVPRIGGELEVTLRNYAPPSA